MFYLLSTTIFILFLIQLWLFSGKKKSKATYPPGPGSYPLVGSLLSLGADPREPLRTMAKKYGDMMTVDLGSRRVVYLNSFELIKEAFVKDGHRFAGRPQDLFFMKELCRSRGIISTEGNLWQEQRRFTHTVLKDLGMGRCSLEPKILEEVQYYLDYLRDQKESIFDAHHITQMAIANIVYSIVNGNRSDYSDPEFVDYMEELNFSFEALANSGIVTILPFLRYLPGDPFSIRYMIKTRDYYGGVFQSKIDAHRENHDPDQPRDLIDSYITQMKKEINNQNSTFNDLQLQQVIGDLFGAGTETTSTTLLWTMIYLLHNENVMKKAQKDIDREIGREKAPSMKDKTLLPYVEAVILEVQRLADIVPYAVPHTCTEDLEFNGYHFPKGTNIMANLYALHRDENIWPNPDHFDPSRHLSEGGTQVIKKEQLIPFSIGRRVCIGESLAKMELFLFVTSLLQKFDVVLQEGEPLPTLVGKLGATHLPYRFKVIFKERQ